jgi:hypothetical protein
MRDQGSLHRRPRHPERLRHLTLVPAVADRLGQRGASRVVLPIPAGTAATASVNEPHAQSALRQRHRRLRHHNITGPSPTGRSFGRVQTHSFGDVDNTRHPAHRAASGSSVTSCTSRTPTGLSQTHSTANPANASRRVASPLPCSKARGLLPLRQTQRESGGHGPPHRRRAERPCPVKIEEPVYSSLTAPACSGPTPCLFCSRAHTTCAWSQGAMARRSLAADRGPERTSARFQLVRLACHAVTIGAPLLPAERRCWGSTGGCGLVSGSARSAAGPPARRRTPGARSARRAGWWP